MILTNRVYDILKWIAQYALPAIGALYFALAKIWHLPYGPEVVGTISAIDAFLGLLLGLSSANYPGDGIIDMGKTEEGDAVITGLNFAIDSEELLSSEKITMKVNLVELANADE